jgi:transcription initiation factor IIE alpha subunit
MQKKTLLRAAEIKNTKEIHDLFEEVRQLEGEYNNSSTQLYEGIFNEINTEGGLYKDQKPEPPAIVKCPECGEQVEEKQLARHTVKKHTPKKQYGGDIDL